MPMPPNALFSVVLRVLFCVEAGFFAKGATGFAIFAGEALGRDLLSSALGTRDAGLDSEGIDSN